MIVIREKAVGIFRWGRLLGKHMDKAELLKLAGQYFISDTGLSVANLIRKIQIAEGHVDCFATDRQRCEQMSCRWRQECLPAEAAGAPEKPLEPEDAGSRPVIPLKVLR